MPKSAPFTARKSWGNRSCSTPYEQAIDSAQAFRAASAADSGGAGLFRDGAGKRDRPEMENVGRQRETVAANSKAGAQDASSAPGGRGGISTEKDATNMTTLQLTDRQMIGLLSMGLVHRDLTVTREA